MNELLEKAMRIAVEAHAGQVDKAGKPYIFHPLRVCARCFIDEEIVALLHDTIEDTEITAEDVDSLNRYIRVTGICADSRDGNADEVGGILGSECKRFD